MILDEIGMLFDAEVRGLDEGAARALISDPVVAKGVKAEREAPSKTTNPLPDVRQLVATIESFDVAYDALSGTFESGSRGFIDEARITMIARIQDIGSKHRHLIGQELKFRLWNSRTFDNHNDPAPSSDPKLLLGLQFFKTGCSAAAYMDSGPFWATPTLLATKAYSRIDLSYRKWPRSRSAQLESYSLGPVVRDDE